MVKVEVREQGHNRVRDSGVRLRQGKRAERRYSKIIRRSVSGQFVVSMVLCLPSKL